MCKEVKMCDTCGCGEKEEEKKEEEEEKEEE